MNKPTVTQILDVIGARLGNISKATGYFFDVRKIERAKLTPFITDDLPAITYHPVRLAVVKTDYRIEKKEVSLYIEFYAMTYDRPFSDVCSELASDLVIALNRDINSPKVYDDENDNLGGLVTAFRMTDYVYQIGEGQSPYCGIVASFRAEFMSKKNDMIEIITG